MFNSHNLAFLEMHCLSNSHLLKCFEGWVCMGMIGVETPTSQDSKDTPAMPTPQEIAGRIFEGF